MPFDIGSADTNRVVIVFVGTELDSGVSLSGITVDGKNCTKITEAYNPDGNGNQTEAWYIDEDVLTTSNGSVTVAIVGGSSDWSLSPQLYTGVDQSGPIGSAINDTETVGPKITTLTSITVSANDLVASVAANGTASSPFGTPTPPLVRDLVTNPPASTSWGTTSAILSAGGSLTFTDDIGTGPLRASFCVVAFTPNCPSSSSSSSSSSVSSSSSSSSISVSSSSSSTTPGTVVYGHDTGTEEDFVEDISGNWTGNNISISGSGDNETLTLHCPSACATNLTWYLGSGSAQIIIDKYQTGQGTLTSIEYKTGTTKVAAEAASWQIYNGTNFNSLGWVVVRLCRE